MEYVEIKQSEDKKYRIYITPAGIDLSKTSYPEGLLAGGSKFDTLSEGQELAEAMNHFMECMIKDASAMVHEFLDDNKYKEEILEIMTTESWTYPYYDYSEEANGLVCYLRLTPPYMDMEKARFSHGISILENRFESEHTDEVKQIQQTIDNIMNESLKSIVEKIVDQDYQKKGYVSSPEI